MVYEPNYGVIAPFLDILGYEGWAILADEDYATTALLLPVSIPRLPIA